MIGMSGKETLEHFKRSFTKDRTPAVRDIPHRCNYRVYLQAEEETILKASEEVEYHNMCQTAE